MEQPSLFDLATEEPKIDLERLLLYALGEFQTRKKILADRELPLDRLRGAFRRAAEVFGTAELTDEELAKQLQKIGAKIVRVPIFVAKHPFRVTVSAELAVTALELYKQVSSKQVSSDN